MTVADNSKKLFQSILRREGLDDFSVFKSGFFDEIPLYSRYAQVKSFRDQGDINSQLLEHSCSYLNSVESHLAKGRSEFFVAITMLDYGKDEPFVPSIFACVGRVKERCTVKLTKPRSTFARSISLRLDNLGLRRRFRLLEDTFSVPNERKVFIGTRKPDSERQLAIDEFEQY